MMLCRARFSEALSSSEDSFAGFGFGWVVVMVEILPSTKNIVELMVLDSFQDICRWIGG